MPTDSDLCRSDELEAFLEKWLFTHTVCVLSFQGFFGVFFGVFFFGCFCFWCFFGGLYPACLDSLFVTLFVPFLQISYSVILEPHYKFSFVLVLEDIIEASQILCLLFLL